MACFVVIVASLPNRVGMTREAGRHGGSLAGNPTEFAAMVCEMNNLPKTTVQWSVDTREVPAAPSTIARVTNNLTR